jgi:hypothetical protein
MHTTHVVVVVVVATGDATVGVVAVAAVVRAVYYKESIVCTDLVSAAVAIFTSSTVYTVFT